MKGHRCCFFSLALLLIALPGASLPAAASTDDLREAQVPFSNGQLTATVPWSPAFPDTNYTAVCTAETTPSDYLLPIIVSRSPGSMQVIPTDYIVPGTLDCIAVPDSDTTDLRHGRTAFGVVAGSITVSWNSPFPDTNYTSVCTLESQSTTEFSSVISAVTPGSVTAVNGGASNGTMHCIAIPDSDTSNIGRGRGTAAGNPATLTIPWTHPFSTTNYTAVCSDIALGALGSDAAIAILAGSKSASTVTVIPEIATGSVDCIGIPASVTFESILSDIQNSLQSGLIDDAGIATALTGKINAAESAASADQNETAINILAAFQNQVAAQTGRHIAASAVQILNQDAASLGGQLTQ